jgi:hypothetical protein
MVFWRSAKLEIYFSFSFIYLFFFLAKEWKLLSKKRKRRKTPHGRDLRKAEPKLGIS